MNKLKAKKYYIDVTEDWLNNKSMKGQIKNSKSITINNHKYFVNDKNKIIHKNKEIKIAKLIIKTFGGTLKYLPNINEKDGIRCGDYFYKNEIWDLKEIKENAKSKKRAIDNVLKSAKSQANNFIIDITNCKIDKDNILEQVKNIYSTKNREWIDKIIIFKGTKLLKVYKRKKEIDTLSKK